MKEIRTCPKIELHCHLDGSIPPDTLRELTGKPELDEKDLTVSSDCASLKEFLEKFDLPLTAMQTREGLRRAAEDFLTSLSEDGVRYVEVRFAPSLSVNQDLDCRKVIEAVLAGLEWGKERTGIYYNVIVCAMRHHSLETNMQALKAAMEFYRSGVCAFDLAGDEAAHPNGEFRELFQKVRDYGIPFTIHSGECGSLANVEAALEFGARRVGHGIALLQSPELMKEFRRRGVGVELCPTSNFQTRAVKDGEEYPLRKFYREDLKVSINTDNRTVCGTDLTRELIFALKELNPSDPLAALEKLQKNAVDTAFSDDSLKHTLWNMVDKISP